MSRRPARHAFAALAVGLLAAGGGCAYYNGVYNARASASHGDDLARRGRVSEANAAYATAAEKAESVLAHFPRSRWRPDALYIAGRSQALLGRCDEAVGRLAEFLDAPGQAARHRDRAELALASCEVRAERYADARRRLEPLLVGRDRELATQAAIWAARAAIALGENEEAARRLQSLPEGAAQWELAAAALERREYARAESLLVLRARHGDFRDDVVSWLRELWSARHDDGVERIVAAYGSARTPAAGKVALDLLAADLLTAAGRDGDANAYLQRAQALAVDSVSARDVAARLCLLQLGTVSASADAEAVVARAQSRAAGSPMYERLRQNLLLMELLERHSDFSGTSLFLAGEVARDSLRAPRLAHAIFTRVASTVPLMPLAPKALLAAAAVLPDSAAAYRQLVRTRYPASPYATLLDGGDPGDMPQYRTVEDELRQGWETGIALLADTLGKLHPAPSPALASGAAASPAATGARGAPATAGAAGTAGAGAPGGGVPAGAPASPTSPTSPRDSASGRPAGTPSAGGRP
ncbi:MAG: tetratricopeptide repeat protein [Gemmatimonadaceae bacterium]